MNNILLVLIFIPFCVLAQSYPPPAGQLGTTAMHKDSADFVGWATGIEVYRGYLDISDQNFEINGNNKTSFGDPNFALGVASGNSGDCVSLGDSGYAIVTFQHPITNGLGYDFAVFENSFSDDFLEFAHVEVSSDGENYVRFPSHSEVQTVTQTNGFGFTDTRNIYNLAGKYRAGFGTPFDLDDLTDSTGIDVNYITHVKIVDVVGSIDGFGTTDGQGNYINDPFPTPFESGGFDLEAIGVIHQLTASIYNNKTRSKVYPNPFNSILNITTEQKLKEIIVLNQHGKSVLQKDVNDFSAALVTAEFSPGLYFLELKFINGEIHHRKLIKIN